MPSQVGNGTAATHLSAYTSKAAGRHVRDLTSSVRAGRLVEIGFLSSTLARSGAHGVAEGDVNALLEALIEGMVTPVLSVRAAVLRATLTTLRAVAPARLARHVLPLARALRTLPGARPLLVLAALLGAAAPLRALPDADALLTAVVDLAAARLSADAVEQLGAPRPVLALALGCLAAAPNLLRPHIDMLRGVAESSLHSACSTTRTTAVALLARLVSAYSPKTRTDAAATIMQRTVAALERTLAVFSRYCGGEPISCVPEPNDDAILATLDEQTLLLRFESLCSLLVALLDAPTDTTIHLPLGRVMKLLCSTLHLTTIDSTCHVKQGPQLSPERVLAVLPDVHSVALETIPTLLHSVGYATALPLAPSVARSIADALLDIMASSKSDSPIAECVPSARAREELYSALASVARLVPHAAVTVARPLAVALLADLDVLRMLHSTRRRQLGGAPPAATGTRRRKRSRVGGAAIAAASAVTRANAPDACVSQDAHEAVLDAVRQGVVAAGTLVAAGALLDEEQRTSIGMLEEIIVTFVALQKEGASQLGKALLSAGSAAAEGKASPLFWSALLSARDVAEMTDGGEFVALAVDAVLHSREAHRPRIAKDLSLDADIRSNGLVERGSAVIDTDKRIEAPETDEAEPLESSNVGEITKSIPDKEQNTAAERQGEQAEPEDASASAAPAPDLMVDVTPPPTSVTNDASADPAQNVTDERTQEADTLEARKDNVESEKENAVQDVMAEKEDEVQVVEEIEAETSQPPQTSEGTNMEVDIVQESKDDSDERGTVREPTAESPAPPPSSATNETVEENATRNETSQIAIAVAEDEDDLETLSDEEELISGLVTS